MPDLLKHFAVSLAGAGGVASATLTNLHGVLRVLARDHRRIQTLLGYALQGGRHEREAFWKQARQELLVHEKAEVDEVLRVLHPKGPYMGLVARHTHDVAVFERRIQEIDELEVGSEPWSRAVGELNQAFRTHAFEEEAELFHWIQEDLGREGLEAAATRVRAAKQRLIANGDTLGASLSREAAIGATGPAPIEPPPPDPPPAEPPGPSEPPMEPPGPMKPPVRPPGPPPPPAKVHP